MENRLREVLSNWGLTSMVCFPVVILKIYYNIIPMNSELSCEVDFVSYGTYVHTKSVLESTRG